jgi:hypothetical protein
MNKDRRGILFGSLGLAAAGISGALRPRTGRAQAVFENYGEVKPALDLGFGGKVTQITMVVRDVQKVARRFAEIFGPSWTFYDYRPKLSVLHGAGTDGECYLKAAVAFCGGQSFRLIQPVSGANAYADFLQAQGEGFYGISVGTVADLDATLAAFRKAGATFEMQGDAGGDFRFVVLQSVDELGLRVEVSSLGTQVLPPALKQTGIHVPKTRAIVDVANPVFEGGKKFTQLGIVVHDGHRGARRWAELFGIRNWRFQSLPATSYQMFGRQFAADELPSTTCEQCVAYLGDTQIELLVPVMQEPGGIHRRFRDRHGNGFQHLMLTPRTPSDHDATLAALWKEGMSKEIEYRLSTNTTGALGHYTGMEEQLGGFVLEY